MKECFSKSFIRNDSLLDRSKFKQSHVFRGKTIYEVIRIIDGIPVFFSDHYMRFEESVRLNKKKVITGRNKLLGQIKLLVKTEGIEKGNIKVVFNYSKRGKRSLVYFIEAHYPSTDQYSKGVSGILYHGERKNPVAKIFNYNLRSSIYNTLISKRAYEALLVNRNDCITEGSRSNIFFIKDNELITAGDEFVLQGITRKYIIEIASRLNIRLVYKCLRQSELKNVDMVFLSGTSPNILPFNMIDDLKLSVSHPLFELLASGFAKIVEEHIRSYR